MKLLLLLLFSACMVATGDSIPINTKIVNGCNDIIILITENYEGLQYHPQALQPNLEQQ